MRLKSFLNTQPWHMLGPAVGVAISSASEQASGPVTAWILGGMVWGAIALLAEPARKSMRLRLASILGTGLIAAGAHSLIVHVI